MEYIQITDFTGRTHGHIVSPEGTLRKACNTVFSMINRRIWTKRTSLQFSEKWIF
jgi:hypothetical protein